MQSVWRYELTVSRTRHHGDKAKERTHGDSWRWLGNYPGWWDTMMHHKPRRQAERSIKHKILRGDEETLWPLDKKPHIYYW
jgi:hypothetical protein